MRNERIGEGRRLDLDEVHRIIHEWGFEDAPNADPRDPNHDHQPKERADPEKE
jgi:hypothetical protein